MKRPEELSSVQPRGREGGKEWLLASPIRPATVPAHVGSADLSPAIRAPADHLPRYADLQINMIPSSSSSISPCFIIN
jgi:hypothetical protein